MNRLFQLNRADGTDDKLDDILDIVRDVKDIVASIKDNSSFLLRNLFADVLKKDLKVDPLNLIEIGYTVVERLTVGEIPMFEVECIESGDRYCVKVFDMKTSEITQCLAAGLTTLYELKSDFIVSLNRAFLLEKSLYLVTEFADLNLKDYVLSNKLSLQQAKQFMISILSAVRCIHEDNIVHGEIKPSKFLIVGDNVKLSNLGFSRSFWRQFNLSPVSSTLQYRSPECLRGEGLSAAADMWSVGCTFYYILMTRDLVGIGVAFGEELNIGTNAVDNELDKLLYEIGREGVDLLKSLLYVDPMLRMSAQDALHHPFLSF